MSLADLQLYKDDTYQPFHYLGGSSAALLVHGFPGTPAEMRPLGLVLHQQGWTVQGLLLPGFGPQIGNLFEQDYQIWCQAVLSALTALQKNHKTVLLVGYSMGGALALQTATQRPPDALVLVAPFWRLGNLMHKSL
ncbi:MAG: alpha/beta fold hydrolase, partial [Chloroflexota bacterium]